MGCGSSKDENPDEIKSEMKPTKIPEYDEVSHFFSYLIKTYFLVIRKGSWHFRSGRDSQSRVG
jgi:hypothetical protein